MFSRTVMCMAVVLLSLAAMAEDAPLETVMGALAFAPDWAAEGAVNQFDPDNLYNYIDGEAEFFFPYGFERLYSVRYTKTGGTVSVMVDVYRLGSLLDAYGVYNSFQRPEGAPVAVGLYGSVTESLCVFCQDRYFVQIAVSGASQLEKEVFETCAKAVSAKLPEAKDPPELAEFRVEGVVKGSDRYIGKSLLAYPFFPKGLIADAKWDGIKGRVFVVLEKSEARAAAALDKYADYLAKGGGAVVASDKDTLSANDGLYKGVLIKRVGSRVLGVINPGAPDQGAAMLARLEKAAPAK